MPCQRRMLRTVMLIQILFSFLFTVYFLNFHKAAPTVTDFNSLTNTSSGRCDPSNFLVAIKSGGSNQRYHHRRNLWRNSICAHTYQQHDIRYRFMIGLPIHHNIDINGHSQAARDTPEEIDGMLALHNESKTFRDIQLIPIRDIYDEMHLKIMHILEWLNQEARGPLVVIHDDEYCVNVDELLSLCHEAVSDVNNSHIFAGQFLWRSAGYEQQRAFDGSFSPYFSGCMNVLSTGLIKNIMEDEDTKYAGIWAPNTDDLQMGRWVDKQKKLNNTSPVRIIERPKLLVPVPECKPIQTSAQCMEEAINLGELSTPAECAKLTASNSACNDTFMFSSTYLDWGCRCCASKGTSSLINNENWALYSASDCGVIKS